ncbi:MAG: nitroreductase family deazaflavin-dependent oxidoreductase [Chloroflexi bacterium]|nr:nitroreductase family deazaflavin-dependent oxidoreductase [Chloroflexota bacterium]
MPIGNKKPRGLLRLGFRLPIWLYRLNLGWILGERFLLLTHTGRKSGLIRQTVIEVVRHDKETDVYLVASGFGHKSDWFLNIEQNPSVTITIKQRTLPARARLLSESDSAKELLDYAKRHPIAFRELSNVLTGKSIEATEESCRQFAKSAPIIAFEPNRT